MRTGRTQNIFIDLSNLGKTEKLLKKGTVLGSVHSVSAVIPMKCFENSIKNANKIKNEKVVVGSVCKGKINLGDKWLPQVDLSHLTREQSINRRL